MAQPKHCNPKSSDRADFGMIKHQQPLDNEVIWQLVPVRHCTMVASRYGHGSFTAIQPESGTEETFVVGGNHTEDLAGKFSIAKLHLHRVIGTGAIEAAGYQREVVQHHSDLDARYPRWGFANVYCSEERRFFMHGGFDSLNKYSDTRFFSPEHMTCSTLGSDGSGPSPRGYHSAIYVPRGNSRGLMSNVVVTFGGQCCIGGPYMYFNDSHLLDLATLNWEHLKCSGDVPSARSQAYGFQWRGCVYIYGGYNGQTLFTDLFQLDLKQRRWSRVTTSGNFPSTLSGLVPKNYRIFPCKPCGVVLESKLVLVLEDYATSTMETFVLNLRSMTWTKFTGLSSTGQMPQEDILLPFLDGQFSPPARGNATLVKSGQHLYVIGGTERNPSKTKCPAPHLWQLTLPRNMSWDRERLLWLACLKNNPWECHLARCPPHLIYFIISLVNVDTFSLKTGRYS